MTYVSPSLLAADFRNLEREIEIVNRSTADYFHVDVMDGVFVPNISFGEPVIRAIHQVAKKPLDVHLMIVDPARYVEQFAGMGATILNVHYEACTHLHRTIDQIRRYGMKPAVTINPHTPVEVLVDIIQDVEMVLVMSVNPGFGGQKFIENTLDKVKRLRGIIDQKGLKTKIEIDGGVDRNTAQRAVNAGVDVLVAGSFIFGNEDPVGAIDWLKKLEKQ